MSVVAVLCLILLLLLLIGFTVLEWFLALVGGHTLAHSMLTDAWLLLVAGGPLVVIALFAQLVHQRARNRGTWFLIAALIVTIPVTVWGMIDAWYVPDETTGRVSEKVTLRADTRASFVQSGVLPHVTITGKPGSGSGTLVRDFYTRSPEIKQLSGLVGHPVRIDPEPDFDSLTIAFEILQQAGPVDLARLKVCELNLDITPLTPAPLPSVTDASARTITAQIDHLGVFALIAQ